MSDIAKLNATKSEAASSRFPDFAITFGAVFAVVYLFVLNYGWQLFTFYPAAGRWTLFRNPASGPAMKWYGYMATTAVIAALAGLIVMLLPENTRKSLRWYGIIWIVPIVCTIILLFLIVVVGD
jgi:hypothetical protein